MNFAVPPRTSSYKTSSEESQGRTVNRLLESELLDLFAAMLIVVPIAVFLRFL